MAATVLECLKSINAYPVPLRTLCEVSDRRGLTLTDEATQEILTGKTYNLAMADILMWLSVAPALSQGGQSYSFSDLQRTQLRSRAYSLYNDFGAGNEAGASIRYGYKGSRL
jgi:hypothetical protein